MMALSQSFGNTPAASAQADLAALADRAALPPPQTFDILPPLHELLARIDHSSADPLTAVTQDTVGYTDSRSLEPKEFPNEVQAVKGKVRKALRELEKLPDMERSVDEQEEEMRELQMRIERQKQVLSRLSDVAKSMQGQET